MAGVPVRRPPYKDFLQPALQRRFASTATVLLTVSYVEAVLLSRWDSFLWSWFPIGPAGFRTAIIFTCGLAILVLRIAQYHVGLRTTGSGIQTLGANLSKLSTYETVFWYCFSSFLFCPVFLWSMPESANLRWVAYFSGNRARANERPVFLACYLGLCAVKQSIEHFVGDVDRLDLGTMGKQEGKDAADASISLKKVLLRLPATFAQTISEALVTLMAAFGIYFLLLRSFAYGWSLMFLRPFYNLPRANLPPATWPLDVFLAVRCLFAGTFLFFIWAAGNTAFSVFMVKEPLKNGLPLTAESKDPNGSLLNGLKSKKQSIQCFAMWELSHISQAFPDRRKAIYADIDRKDGPMWSQVYAVCMEVLRSIETRVDNYGKPATPPPAPAVEEPKQRTLPPLRSDNILTPENHKPGAGSKAKEVVKIITSGSKSSSSPLSELSPIAKKTWDRTKDHVLTREQQQAMSPENVRTQVQQLALGLMNLSWVRALLQRTFRNELAGAVLGTPYAESALYVNAANALCQLAVHSLGEDQFGNVHRDVPSIIRTLTSVIRKVEALKESFPVHWTDTSGTRESPEVNQVLDAMRTGLGQVVTSFEPYCHDLRLTPGDLRHAKEAAAVREAQPEPQPEPQPEAERMVEARQQSRPEMEQVRSRGGRRR